MVGTWDINPFNESVFSASVSLLLVKENVAVIVPKHKQQLSYNFCLLQAYRHQVACGVKLERGSLLELFFFPRPWADTAHHYGLSERAGSVWTWTLGQT